MAEPVELDDLKAHLRLDPDSTGEDAYLTSMITGARRACEMKIRRSIVGGPRLITLPGFPGCHPRWPMMQMPLEAHNRDELEILLPGGEVLSIDSISYFDPSGVSVPLDASAYVFDIEGIPARIAPVSRWPATAQRPGAVTINYTLLPLDADDTAIARQAMLLIMDHWYRNRAAVAVDIRGVPTELPLSATWLLAPLDLWPSA